MARVAREVVQKAGIDVEKLLVMLLRNASAELTKYYILYHPASELNRPRR